MDNASNVYVHMPGIAMSGRNIMAWSQLKIRHVVQHLLCMKNALKGHHMMTQIKSQT